MDLPEIFDVSNAAAAQAGIVSATRALSAGRLVGMPTETVYGLAADATSDRAVAGIFAAKNRPRFNPLIIHVSSLDMAEAFAEIPPAARPLVEAFWPGPLTIVMPWRSGSGLGDLVTAGLDTVAVRMPAHPVARSLIEAFGRPLAAPSANRSGHVSPTTAAHVAADLGSRVAVILDAGPTGIGLESTIVGFDGDRPRLLRPGGLSRERLEEALGQPLTTAEADDQRPTAPGMLSSHYAPATAVRLGATSVEHGEALLAFGGDLPEGAENATSVFNLSESGDLAEAAANLFAAMRRLDGAAASIAVMPIPETGLGEAINDRLRRAAAPRPSPG